MAAAQAGATTTERRDVMEPHVSPRKKSIKDLFEGLKASRRKLKLRCDSLGKRIVLLTARVTLLVRKFVHLSLKTERLDSRITDLENAHAPVLAVTAVPPAAAATPAEAPAATVAPRADPVPSRIQEPSKDKKTLGQSLFKGIKNACLITLATVIGLLLCFGVIWTWKTLRRLSQDWETAHTGQSVVVVANDARVDENNILRQALAADRAAIVDELRKLKQEKLEKTAWEFTPLQSAPPVTKTVSVTIFNKLPDDSCVEDDSDQAEESGEYVDECPQQAMYYRDQLGCFIPIDPTMSFRQPVECYSLDPSGCFAPVDLALSFELGFGWWRDGSSYHYGHYGPSRRGHQNSGSMNGFRGDRGNSYGHGNRNGYDGRRHVGQPSPGYGGHRTDIGRQSPDYGVRRPGIRQPSPGHIRNRGPGNNHGNRGSNTGHGNHGSGGGHAPPRKG